MVLGKIFANKGPGLAKEAGQQGDISKVLLGDKNHFAKTKAKAAKKLSKKGKEQGYKQTLENMASTAKRNVSDYMSAQDLNYKDTVHLRNKAKMARAGMATVAGATAVIAPRVMSGGDLTTNGKGEKDIAGIPFI